MIWFGKLERLFIGPVPPGLPEAADEKRMQFALERVAEVAPWLTGDPLIDALAATGWVDRETASRLFPVFRHFDPDRHFGDYMRRLSFRGRTVEEEFRYGIRSIFQEIVGNAELCQLGPEACIRFEEGDRQFVALCRPEVGLTVAGTTREALLASIEEMPDAVLLIARSFERSAVDQVSSVLSRTGIPGSLVTVNHLLGLRATALRFGSSPEMIADVLALGGSVGSVQVARLGDQSVPQRFHIPGWNSSSTV